MTPPAQRRIWIAAALAVLGLFAVVVFAHVFVEGVCCADDATNAIVAKNLARGDGYGNSLRFDGTSGFLLFDPEITTGPTLILPAALLIRAVGNTLWAPGFVTAACSVLLLLVIFVVWSRALEASAAALYLVLLIAVLYAATAGLYFEQWFSLLGEIPAALLCVLGGALAATRRDERTGMALAGVCFGLAVNCKLLALLSFLPLLTWACWECVPFNRPGGSSRLAALVGGFSGPLILFEAWKLIALGPLGYVRNLRSFLSFLRKSSQSDFTTLWSRWPSTTAVLQETWRVGPLAIVIVTLLFLAIMYFGAFDRRVRRFALLMVSAAAVNAVWWFAQHRPWPRYALIGLCLYLAALATVAFSTRRAVLLALVLGLTVGVAIGPRRLSAPVSHMLRYRFMPGERAQNLARSAAFLDAHRTEAPFICGWWATGVDLDYAMKTTGNMIGYRHAADLPRGTGHILARNTTWVGYLPQPEFSAFSSRCTETLLDAAPYVISRCP